MLEDLQGRKVVPVISNMPRFKFSYASGDINLTTKSQNKKKNLEAIFILDEFRSSEYSLLQL